MRPISCVLVIGTICCLGCGGDSNLLPLKLGRTWTYRVRTKHYTYIEPVKVVRKAPVGEEMGFLVQSELGDSRLGWQGGSLVAESLGHSRFVPPLPICLSDPDGGSTNWQGLLVLNGKTSRAKASLRCTEEDLRWKGQKQFTRRSDLVLEFAGSRIEWTSWFVPGDGIIRQEQRTNGELDLSLEMINGT